MTTTTQAKANAKIAELLKRGREDDNSDVRIVCIDDTLGPVEGNTVRVTARCLAEWPNVSLPVRRKIAADLAANGAGSVLAQLQPADQETLDAIDELPAHLRVGS